MAAGFPLNGAEVNESTRMRGTDPRPVTSSPSLGHGLDLDGRTHEEGGNGDGESSRPGPRETPDAGGVHALESPISTRADVRERPSHRPSRVAVG